MPSRAVTPTVSRLALGVSCVVAMFAALLGSAAPAGAVGPCGPPIVNPVACENTKAGNPSSQWDVSGSGDSTIQGFATDISVNVGATVGFKVKTPASSYRIEVYRLGFYGGMGARLVTTLTPSAALPQTQPACKTVAATGLVDCGNWAQSASWAVPATAVSGVYLALLVRPDTGGRSHIVFVVRDDARNSDILYQTSDTTWQAYNRYGGNSLYTGSPAGRAYKVSYNRPFSTRGCCAEDWLFTSEYPAIRWLESNGYDVAYSTGVDSDRRGNLIKNHRAFFSVGHDEYWSGGQRTNVEAARAAGVNLAFLSGNEGFWKTRWENSVAGTTTAYRTLVSYKETHANAVIDPADPPTWTGTWRDPRFSPPADGGRPENALQGTIFTVNQSSTTDAIRVPQADGRMRLWRNTDVATLPAGGSTTLTTGTLGYEWDEDVDNGFRPPGLFHASSTTLSVAQKLLDYGSTYGAGTATHSLTLYRHASGALVFGAGTAQWSWALDGTHDGGASTPDGRARQAMVNLLADMGVQPATLQSGLTPASMSADSTRPTSSITSPAAGATIPAGTPVTISGTAADTGGGVVGGVEVSVDGGTTWHPASGRASWSYAWTPGTTGAVTIKSRAADDSGNLELPATGITVQVSARACPCTIFPSTATPGTAGDPDASAVELGVKFQADTSGLVTGIRYYKASTNTGTHTGTLWSATGTKLATATFTGEGSSGWQQVSFSSPVAVSANTTYVASYHTNVGHYAADNGYFSPDGVDAPPLHALGDATSVNGVYAYGATSTFPTDSYQATNYWVDVVFTTSSASDTTPPTVTTRVPSAGATSVSPATTVKATFSEPVQAATISFTLSRTDNGTSVAGTVAYDAATNAATFTPSSALANGTGYTARVSGAKDTAGNTMIGTDTWSFTTSSASDTTPPTVTARVPSAGATSVSPATSVKATFSEPVQAATISFTLSRTDNGTSVAGTVAYDAATNAATFTPSSALANGTGYSAQVSGAKDTAGNTMTGTDTWSFTTSSASACPCTIFANATPVTPADPDASAVELGVKFRSDVGGFVTGVRFYKSTTNTGTHTGSLWSATGTRLATATFTAETASGWQQVTFSTPVAMSAGTTYVASYHTNTGHYAGDGNGFAASVDNAPLHALANGVSPNGVYRYGASGFPTDTFDATNYWVDVTFTTQ